MSRSHLLSAIAGALLTAACDRAGPIDPDPLPSDFELGAVEVASGLDRPLHLAAPPGDPRLFVVEQTGRIRVIADGVVAAEPFLDLSDLVSAEGEQGLLGLAFHPGYATNGFLYVNYTDRAGDTRVVRYRASTDPARADAASARTILEVDQPAANHNGGMLAFGPDGMLYVGLGDGGGGGDPLEAAQDPSTVLGSLLRIDVDGGEPYAVPAGNPYLGVAGARPEIWAIGLRNPWRFSFDAETELLYLADVGQNRREEINVVEAGAAGLNFGWDVMEGSACFEPSSGCDPAGLVLPVLEYPHGDDGCSVTGGYVYRGSALPELRGHYFHADFCRPTLRSFRRTADGAITDEREWDAGVLGNVTSFGVDAAGELYVVVRQGRIYGLIRG